MKRLAMLSVLAAAAMLGGCAHERYDDSGRHYTYYDDGRRGYYDRDYYYDHREWYHDDDRFDGYRYHGD